MDFEFKQTRIWQNAFVEPQPQEKAAANELMVHFEAVRKNVASLATSYQQHNLGFTNHKIEHFDALWLIADRVLPEDFQINPLEVFVLGLTFLTHDLGMGIATYPGGEAEIKEEKLYKDLLRRAEENLKEGQTVEEQTLIADFLRTNHAKKALGLLSQPFSLNGQREYLLADPTLRKQLADIVGKIAASHHWNIERVASDLPNTQSHTLYPSLKWKIEPKKLAGILRLCDACHISGERAEFFARVGRDIRGLSKNHWDFHSKLGFLEPGNGRLTFRSVEPFTKEESNAWWLAYDAVTWVAQELTNVRRLFRDHGLPELRLVDVEGADRPEMLKEFIETSAWDPADVRLQVSDVTHIVETLGGAKLYGEDYTVPLRELIQNARDAVKAREHLYPKANYRGRIDVRLVEDGDDLWLEVEDDGIGMTPQVMTGPLLDFGKSYWRSRDILFDLEGLASSGFESAGQFGIGFFSVFMLGKHVQVISNRFGRGADQTRVLEFSGGAGERPILRHVAGVERNRPAGTLVRVKLAFQLPAGDTVDGFSRMLTARDQSGERSFGGLLAWLAPALDVDLHGETPWEENRKAVSANDWLTLHPQDLFLRIRAPYYPAREDNNKVFLQRYSFDTLGKSEFVEMATYRDKNGKEKARLSFGVTRGEGIAPPFVLTSCGIRIHDAFGLFGILEGRPTTVDRSDGKTTIEREELVQFFKEILEGATGGGGTSKDKESLMIPLTDAWRAAKDLRAFPLSLPFLTNRGEMSVAEIRQYAQSCRYIVLYEGHEISVVTEGHYLEELIIATLFTVSEDRFGSILGTTAPRRFQVNHHDEVWRRSTGSYPLAELLGLPPRRVVLAGTLQGPLEDVPLNDRVAALFAFGHKQDVLAYERPVRGGSENYTLYRILAQGED